MGSFKKTFFLYLVFCSTCVHAQVKISIATDFSVLHNFDGKQKFTVVGQTLIPQWHFDQKNTLYAWFTYHATGKYKTDLVATAKAPSTQPQTFIFTTESTMKLRQLSIGFKRYVFGAYDKPEGFSAYVAGGFGLIAGTASNSFSTYIDTALYTTENNAVHGAGDFKRLSFDITGGVDFPVSYELFVYTEIRLHIPTSDYPNNYLLKNPNSPFLGGINLGIRVLFNADP